MPLATMMAIIRRPSADFEGSRAARERNQAAFALPPVSSMCCDGVALDGYMPRTRVAGQRA
jgi:hypothetical protein